MYQFVAVRQSDFVPVADSELAFQEKLDLVI